MESEGQGFPVVGAPKIPNSAPTPQILKPIYTLEVEPPI